MAADGGRDLSRPRPPASHQACRLACRRTTAGTGPRGRDLGRGERPGVESPHRAGPRTVAWPRATAPARVGGGGRGAKAGARVHDQNGNAGYVARRIASTGTGAGDVATSARKTTCQARRSSRRTSEHRPTATPRREPPRPQPNRPPARRRRPRRLPWPRRPPQPWRTLDLVLGRRQRERWIPPLRPRRSRRRPPPDKPSARTTGRSCATSRTGRRS